MTEAERNLLLAVAEWIVGDDAEVAKAEFAIRPLIEHVKRGRELLAEVNGPAETATRYTN